jgi:electron transfer flavoprotein alpha subunit
MQPHDASGGTILAFSENADTGGELLGAACHLAQGRALRIVTAVLESDASEKAQEFAARADEVVVVQTGADRTLGIEELDAVVRDVFKNVDPQIVLIGASRTGADVAARLAQALEVPCASDCVPLAIDPQGNLVLERRVYGGRFVAREIIAGRPCVVTVALKRFAKSEPRESRGSIRELIVALPMPRVRTRSISPRPRSDRDITKASVIVAAGRGVKNVEDLALLDRLAGALDGILAGTRPLTGELDWLPVDRRVGLSGQTVKPNLYIACGVSGQIEHIVGMKDARTVVAINNDPKAPIHAEADYSIVGDLYEIVPALLEAYATSKPSLSA